MSFPGGRQLYFGNMVINSQWIWKREALHIISVQWEEGENVRTVHTSAVSGQDHFPNPFEGHDVLRMCNRTIWWKWSDSKIFEEMAEKGGSWSKYVVKMPGGRRGLVAPQNTFLENIIRRCSQQRKSTHSMIILNTSLLSKCESIFLILIKWRRVY